MKKLILFTVLVALIGICMGFVLGRNCEMSGIVSRINQFPNERESYSETEIEYIIFGESQL